MPEKGIFIFLEAAAYLAGNAKFEFVVLGAGHQTPTGKLIASWLKNAAKINYVPAVIGRDDMAGEYARADIVVVPSRNDNWHEPFGMTSVEGQHAGCRVIASDSGGLKETDCGLLQIIDAGNAVALAEAIARSSQLPLPNESERAIASAKFSLKSTVDDFLEAIGD